MPTYLYAGNNVTTIDGNVAKVEAGTLNLNISTDEVTNSASGGYYEDVATIRQAKITGARFVFDAEDPPAYIEGDLVVISCTIVNGPTLSGTFRIGSLSIPMMDVKAAIHYSCDVTSQGVYTWTWGGTP
jgi:hypothetical protein